MFLIDLDALAASTAVSVLDRVLDALVPLPPLLLLPLPLPLLQETTIVELASRRTKELADCCVTRRLGLLASSLQACRIVRARACLVMGLVVRSSCHWL
jgi:hypothetical protein